jgi:hypothetical protein
MYTNGVENRSCIAVLLYHVISICTRRVFASASVILSTASLLVMHLCCSSCWCIVVLALVFRTTVVEVKAELALLGKTCSTPQP